jgi:SAM-dependent methyltransferase
MLDGHVAEMRELEDHYWWFVARRRIALALLDQRWSGAGRLLDGGFGAGALLAELARRGPAFGVDASASAVALTQERGLSRLVRGDVQALPFRSESFGAVTLCDVLEHVDDDRAAVLEAVRVLKPGGLLILTLPALKILWSAHDEALAHRRRYDPQGVRQMLEAAGLHVERLSYGLCFLFPVALALRSLQRLFRRRDAGPPRTGIIRVPVWVNRLLIALMDVENALLARANLPVGVSIVAVARRPTGQAK